MTSKLRDFNLLKVADVSSNSTTTNSVSVVVNADSSGNSQNSSNEAVNFTQTPTPIYPQMGSSTILQNSEAAYQSVSNQAQIQIQELEYRIKNMENDLKFYKLLSSTLSNLLKDNNTKLIINLIDQSGKIIIDAPTLIELIAIKTNTDANSVNITFVDEEPNCLNKVSPIKVISNIKINDETFNLKYNREFNILQDTFNISLTKTIIEPAIIYH